MIYLCNTCMIRFVDLSSLAKHLNETHQMRPVFERLKKKVTRLGTVHAASSPNQINEGLSLAAKAKRKMERNKAKKAALGSSAGADSVAI